MADIAQDQHHVVSPLDEPRHQTRALPSHGLVDPPTTQEGAHTSNVHLAHSASESTLVSKNWQPPSTTTPKKCAQWWPWEWLCELLALGSLGAMVLVLMHYHDKPQSKWQQSSFTLNGLIAFLATLMKTGIIIPVSAAIGQRKWLRFLPSGNGKRRARRLADFETYDEASRGSLGSAKLMISLNLL